MLDYESLHNHTTTSDGVQSYLDVLKTAEKKGFGTIAFTDHDSLPSDAALAELRSYEGPLKWLIGIEMTSGLPRELGGGPVSLFHIIGLFVDVTNKPLREHCTQAQHARKERMERIVENLNNIGFTVTQEDCLEASGGESVGRPHIVSAIVKHEENHTLLMKIADDMKAESVNNADLEKAYTAMMVRFEDRGIQDLVYTLLLTDTAYIPDIYVDYLYSIDMDKSVSLIRNAGGVAILAHWPTVEKKIPLDMVRGFLKDGRLDGIETVSGTVTREQDHTPSLEALVKETGCVRSVGADAHRPEDFERFVTMPDRAVNTPGTLAALLEKTQSAHTFSNLG